MKIRDINMTDPKHKSKMAGAFTFHGVGQGLFYSGSVTCNGSSAFNFVYDCGSNSEGWDFILDKRIAELPNDLDFIAISHFHEDHINGIVKILKSHKFAVSKIYIPYLYGDKSVLVIKAFAYCYIDDPEAREFLISVFDSTRNSNMFPEIKQKIRFIKRQRTVKSNGWVFEFYNRKCKDSIIEKLIKDIEDLLRGRTIESFFDTNPQNAKRAIREVFESGFGKKSINLSSLVLLHYPKDSSQRSTLLTGDVVFDKHLNDTIGKKYISDNVFGIEVLQAPHHGSRENWFNMSHELRYNSKNAVFSFGLANKYGHPNYICVLDRLSHCSPSNHIYFVHEDYEGKVFNYSYSIEV